MANTLKNTSLVTRFAIKEFMNSLVMAKHVDRQLDEKRVYNKVGSTVNVRRPIMFAATDGAVITGTSDIEEQTVPVELAFRKKVWFSITSEEETLNIEDANTLYIKPAMQELAQQVESALADSYKEIYNLEGTPGTPPGSFLDVANAGAKLDSLGVPMMDRAAFYEPYSSASLANGLRTVFPQSIATKAIEKAAIGEYAGFDMFKSQSLKVHTVGAWGGTPLVNGASQEVVYTAAGAESQSLITDGWDTSVTGLLNAGDVFTIAGVNSVNRKTRQDTGRLQQFVVLANADSDATGNATLSVSPAMIVSGAYQTVTVGAADNAAITVVTGAAGTSYPQNLAFHRNAITLAVAQLDLPSDGATSARENFDGISIRTVKQYQGKDDETIVRLDILFGVKVQNGGFAVRTTG
jgi:hypothetical protein